MLTKLAVWYLRKAKKSVLIGYEIEGGYVKASNCSALTYDNTLVDVDYRTCDGEPFLLPNGKFSVTRKNKA